jgi:hypothetical protein
MLARTKAYGRTSAIAAGERPPADSFAAMNIKTLTASQYYDSIHQNVLLGRFSQASTSPQASAQADQMVRQQFLTRMQAAGSAPTDYPHGVVQALGMMNGPEMLAATGEHQSGLIASLDAPFFSDADRIETLFLACLSRRPNDAERKRFLDYLHSRPAEQTASSRLSDLTWVLLNTAECYTCP